VGTRLSKGAVVAALLASSVAFAQQPKAGQPVPPKAGQPAPTPQPTPAPPQTAADFAKQGNELYAQGDFAGAVAPLQKAVELEPTNFEYRFTLAQALRQSGNCGDAVPQYKQALASAPAERSEEVKGAMGQCPNAEPPAPPPMPPAPPPPPPQTTSHGSIRTSDALMLVGAGAGLATGLCLAFAAHSDADDANAAATFDDHSRIEARSERLYVGAIIGAGVGVALGAIAMYRIKSSHEGTQVSLSPRKSGGMLVLERAW
jgi:tetratricopeptide (TPR) repeat protein